MDVPDHVTAAAQDCAMALSVIDGFSKMEVNGVEVRAFVDGPLSHRTRILVHAHLLACSSSTPSYFVLLTKDGAGPSQIHACGELPAKLVCPPQLCRRAFFRAGKSSVHGRPPTATRPSDQSMCSSLKQCQRCLSTLVSSCAADSERSGQFEFSNEFCCSW